MTIPSNIAGHIEPLEPGDPTRAHVGTELTTQQFEELQAWRRRRGVSLSRAAAELIEHGLRTLAPRPKVSV